MSFENRGSGVVLLTMQDRAHKNTFSPALIGGLQSAYRRIEEEDRHKAVVLTGYGPYFSCGGTREGLLALNDTNGHFTDADVYTLASNCRIPVIAAMQGHAIGGGLIMGLFCDIVILGRESLYAANFMKYGFTPGMGATYIMPEKLGMSLGHEMLLSAANYSGATLEARGVPFSVLSRNQVLAHALGIAAELADKPRLSLMTLKRHLNRKLQAALPSIIEQELAMHALTMHQPEVRHRISTLFDS
ncbi:polyketide synthase [Chromobacterium sp. IIBBL 290-4]|uniref:polyketide synthase n=1 Tax=Chromobacterium sp. IIBBL 290-4 TaxID=2953890 RepID=UPI0020B7651E|nr:polyketide synthase [Chromobacterium sp. IIBBL 290-4]UTH76444.1 polyketide synthase [Chromobacterium sp. IIBBL 290-4]